MTYSIETRNARKSLKSRTSPYWKKFGKGFYIGYRKNKSSSAWMVRRFIEGEYVIRRLAETDDQQKANGFDILSFDQARKKANNYEDVLEQVEPDIHPALFTVTQAVTEYLEWFKTNRKSYDTTKAVCDTHIIPALGHYPVTQLTTARINKWLNGIATAHPMTPTGNPKPPFSVKRDTGERNNGRVVYEFEPVAHSEWTDEMKRKRKSSANRILTILRAALNYAWRNDGAYDRGAWQKVKPFENVDAPKVSYLTAEEAAELIQVASDDFKSMAKAALLTGCRYGELTRLKVRDFEGDQIYVEISKNGKDRHVPLNPDGQKFFAGLARDKNRDDFLITHLDGSAWKKSHQTRPMKEACEQAAIEVVGIHVLRHTYATLLLRSKDGQGVSIRHVAALIGDSVATCEKYYGHVVQEDLQSEVTRKLPSFGIAG